MLKVLNRNKILIAIIVAFIIICLSMGILSADRKAIASDNVVWDDDDIIIAHITDTHYYPLRFNYAGDSEEYFDYIHEQFHKMWLESEPAFHTAMENIKKMEPLPDYLVVTGDNAQDGERQSHIDVANGLRKLQNEIRTMPGGKPNFQVFATFGNHDLYNPAVYDFSTGTKKKHKYVSRKDITKIYASLGYPDIEETEAQDFYKLNNEFDGYCHSTTSENIKEIKYQYEEINKVRNDYEVGELTYIVETKDGKSFISLDIIESNIKEGHVLGAILTDDTQTFLTENKKHNDFCIGLAHHSIVPHFTMQKEILTGFIVDDWVNVADFLADYGMRYVFTGHMHSNDIAHHISFNNNQITDIEAAANLSVASNVRHATIKTGNRGTERVQNLYVQNYYLEEVDISSAIDGGYLTEKYIEHNGLEEYIDWDTKMITDYSGYAEQRMFGNTVKNSLNAYLNPSVFDKLKDMLDENLPDSFWGIPLSALKSNINQLIDEIIDEINTKVLADYEYDGDNPIYKDNKILGFASELADRVLAIEIAEGHKLFDFMLPFYLNHVKGNEPDSIDELPEYVQEGLEYIRTGRFIEDLFDILLDKETGLYFLVDKLASTPLELSEDLGVEIIIYLSGLKDEVSVTNFIIGEVIPLFLNTRLAESFGMSFNFDNKPVMQFLDDSIDGYFTDALYSGLGEIVDGILLSLGTDPVFDGNETKTLILLDDSDTFTYTSAPRADIPTIENGKMPSKITVTFGTDTSTDKNFTWFTDMRITDSEVQYMEGKKVADFDPEKALTADGDSQVYGQTVGLIDIGIFAQLGYVEVSRHTVELTDLKPNTEYLYRVGSKEFGYYSEVFTFKTAPSKENAPFEVLLITDPQGFTNKTYQDVGEVLENAQSVFKNGYDFVINTGDLVDNSRNVTQYNYYLNTLREYWGNTTQVIAVGNHGKYNFELKDSYKVSSDEVLVDEYNYMLMHFNFSIPEQDTTTGAYYSYDYSGVHFTVLNTNDIIDDKMSDTQIEWLKADLQSTKKKHKVVLMHKSLYSAGAHSYDAEVVKMRKQLGGIFEDNGVHLVLSGHDHTYNETYYLDRNGEIIQLANNRSSKVSNKGTLFVNLGCVGNKFYKYVENDKVPVFTGAELHDPTLSRPTFGKLVFDGKNLYYQGYEYDFDTQKVIAIKPPLKFTTVELVLIIVGSVVGAAGLAVGAFFIIKALKAKKQVASTVKAVTIDTDAKADSTITDTEVVAEALVAKDEEKEK